MIQFDQVWSSLIQFDPIWSNLIQFDPKLILNHQNNNPTFKWYHFYKNTAIILMWFPPPEFIKVMDLDSIVAIKNLYIYIGKLLYSSSIFSLFSKQIIDLNNSRKLQENIVQYSIIPLQQMHFKCVCAFVHIGSV